MTTIRKNTLIRKRLPSSSTPVGPWLIVRSSVKGKIKAERIDPEYVHRATGDFSELDRNMVYIPKRAALNISPGILLDLASGKQWIITHPATTRWEDLCKNNPEIITFYAANGNKVIVSVDEVKLFQRDRKPWVKIFIRGIITKCIWS